MALHELPEMIPPEPQDVARLAQFSAALDTPHHPRIHDLKTYPDGTTVIIPTYNNAARAESIQVTLDSLRDQQGSYHDPIVIYIADNGMTMQQASNVKQYAESLALPLRIVEAYNPINSSYGTGAGYARNIALEAVRARAEQDASERRRNILFLDDDAALLPGTLSRLDSTKQEYSHAAAITTNTLPVAKLDRETYQGVINNPPADEEPSVIRLPEIIRDGAVQMGVIVAFSGDITTKTAGLLVDFDVYDRIAHGGGKLFIKWPNGSFEDMAAGLALRRHGTIFANRNAFILDEVRSENGAMYSQKANWGRDHVIAWKDIIDSGYAHQGVHILEPGEGVWNTWTIPNYHHYGVVNNPLQLSRLVNVAERMLKNGDFNSLRSDFTPDKIRRGLTSLRTTLRYIEQRRPYAHVYPRKDLPNPFVVKPVSRRWDDDVAAAQLVGNLIGINDIQHISEWQIPRVFVFAVRQYGKWENQFDEAE